MSAKNSPEANLTQIEAEERARRVSNIHYTLAVGLSEVGERFRGDAKIRFDWKPEGDKGSFLEIDARARIQSLTVNGVKLAPIFSNHRLILPFASLRTGANVVEVTYDQAYARDGRGLHRFADPEDQRVYMYTHFEAYDAHHLFPCFDQPDLKARMDLKVTAPKAWTVISTTRESSINQEAQEADARVWIFPTTPLMSTYLFSLHAGPYHQWNARGGSIPLRLFSRQSLVKYVHPQDWFKPTQRGLKFFADFFGVRYPFKKYDQVIAPEFNAGAMENIAAITFSERYLSRGVVTRDEREDLTEVILHEMAHQWFGDLVTMRWWNGLWLNESFATYMAQLAKARATEFKDAWAGFSLHQKSRAYLEDQLTTTHPIDGKVPDTDSAFSNFDSITYGKGASVLKQLSFLIGESSFRKGLKQYFERHSYGNTTLSDFLAALENASGFKLADWSKAWLETAGVDTVQADFNCDQGRITNLELKVRGPDGIESARPHRARIALYKIAMGKLLPYKVVTATYQGRVTALSELRGAACPALVFANDDDQDYVKIQFATKTRRSLLTGFSSLSSPQARAILWPGLFDMVRDGELKPQEYLALAEAELANEKDPKFIEAIIRRVATAFHYLPQLNESEKSARLAWIAKFERILLARMSQSATDLRLAATDGFLRIAESLDAQQNLLSLLKGASLDQDRRWAAIIRLSMLGMKGSDEFIAAEKRKDSSERGIKMAYAAEASAPIIDRKHFWLHRLIAENDLSYVQKREVFQNFLPPTQVSFRLAVSADFYSTLPELAKTQSLSMVNLYVRGLLPTDCTPQPAAKLAGFIKTGAASLPFPTIKALKNGLQEDEICQRARASAQAGGSI